VMLEIMPSHSFYIDVGAESLVLKYWNMKSKVPENLKGKVEYC